MNPATPFQFICLSFYFFKISSLTSTHSPLQNNCLNESWSLKFLFSFFIFSALFLHLAVFMYLWPGLFCFTIRIGNLLAWQTSANYLYHSCRPLTSQNDFRVLMFTPTQRKHYCRYVILNVSVKFINGIEFPNWI